MHGDKSFAGCPSVPVRAALSLLPNCTGGSGKEIAEGSGAAVFSVSVEFCQLEEIWQCQATFVSSLTQSFVLSTRVSRE